jgi:hypothetical protein
MVISRSTVMFNTVIEVSTYGRRSSSCLYQLPQDGLCHAACWLLEAWAKRVPDCPSSPFSKSFKAPPVQLGF